MAETNVPERSDTAPQGAPAERFRIVVGVSGGIAAYKAVLVVRELVLLGHDVHVIPTEAALRFVGRPTFEAISRNPVSADFFDDVEQVRHVALGQRADVIAVVPATANTMAKMTAGLADDLLGTTLLASAAPLVIAPAMHTEMWGHPATQANARRLDARGVTIVGPGDGRLTGDDSGPGRLEDVDVIVGAILAAARRGVGERAARAAARDLEGVSVLVTAGGTREPLDPVRFLGNRSSGRQGVAIAERAAERGAHVILVAANLEVPAPEGVRLVEVTTAEQMHGACVEIAPRRDVVIMAAAVADYRPEAVSEGKIAKEEQGETLTITFTKNPDILRALTRTARDDQTIVGFAAETEPDDEKLLERARAKLARKGCDLLVLNRVGWQQGFQTAENEVRILERGGAQLAEGSGDKMSVADLILDVVRDRRARG